MKRSKQLIINILLIAILFGWILYKDYYRLSPLQATEIMSTRESFDEPDLQIVEYVENDAIVYAIEKEYVSCYFVRKSYGILWKSFAGYSLFRKVEDISVIAQTQYKRDCVYFYEVNDMKNRKW